jgi:hypothetical protein
MLRGSGSRGIFPSMNDFGKALVILGAALVVAGLLLWKTNLLDWLGRLPGDIHFSGKNGSFHFPIVTCLLISAVVSIVIWLLRR